MACHDTLSRLGNDLEAIADEQENTANRLLFLGIASEVWKALQEHLKETKEKRR